MPKQYDFVVYSDIPFKFDYTTEEIETKVVDILTKEYPTPMPVISICHKIMDTALDEKRAIGADCKTYYPNCVLSLESAEKIYKVLHKLTKEEKILYCFNDEFKLWNDENNG